MNTHNLALGLAGVIGCSVALIHGVLIQRGLVEPLEQLAAAGVTTPLRRLIPLLMQFSTFNWFVGGLALIIAAVFFGQQARLATGVLVGSSYLFGAVGNLWGVRGPHPGWILYAIALALITYALTGPEP